MIPRAAFILFLCSAIPSFADVAYMITAGPDDQFGTIDLTTGIFTSLGTTEVGSTPETLAGLGEVGGVLYGAAGDTLYSINTANGALTVVGTGTQEFIDFGSTSTGLYGLSSSNDDLYSVSTADGSDTQLGPTTLGVGVGGGSGSFSTGSSTLYFTVYDAGYNLYTLNTTTGAANEIGPTGTPTGALLWDSGTLYAGQTSPATDAVDTLNTSTGAAMVGPTLTGTGSGDQFDGLAPIPSAVPEPASVLLFGTLIAGVFFLRRKKHTVLIR